jgi:hypothetical protein
MDYTTTVEIAPQRSLGSLIFSITLVVLFLSLLLAGFLVQDMNTKTALIYSATATLIVSFLWFIYILT